MEPARLLWVSRIFDRSGYAAASRNHLRGLHQIGFPVHLRPLDRKFDLIPDEKDLFWFTAMRERKAASGAVLAVMHPPTLEPESSFLRTLRRSNPEADFRVAYTMFETDRIPPDWVRDLEEFDEIWVPSRFNLSTFARSGLTEEKIRVVPLSVDTRQFDPLRHLPDRSEPLDEFKFLSIFEWIPRKGWDLLLRAYCEEFRREEKVSLTLLCYRGKGCGRIISTPLEQQLSSFLEKGFGKGLPELPRIRLLTEPLTDGELPGLYLSHDAFVLASRGEGWGMPMCEAMAMGLPTAAPRWGGQLEFMSEENAYLIDIDGLVPVDPEQAWENPIYAGHLWAEPSLSSIRKTLRRMFECREEGRKKGQLARRHIEEHFSSDKVAARIASRAKEILAQKTASPLREASPSAAAPARAPRTAAPIPVALRGGKATGGGHARVDREFRRRMIPQRGFQLVEETDAPRILISHDIPPSLTPPPAGCKWIWFVPWARRDPIPLEWLSLLQERVDEVWVCNGLARQAYLRAGIPDSRIFELPLGVDTALFRPEGPAFELPTRKNSRILTVLSWRRRQALENLLAFFPMVFRAADDVALVLKLPSPGHPEGRDELVAKLHAFQKVPAFAETVLIEEELSDEEMGGLYRAATLFFAPFGTLSHGSAILEAMASGVPVVAPGGSGLDSLLLEERSFPFGPRTESSHSPPGTLLTDTVSKGGCKLLRHLLESPELARFKSDRALEFVRQERTWDRTLEFVAGRIDALLTPGRVERPFPSTLALLRKGTSLPSSRSPFAAKFLEETAEGHGIFGALSRESEGASAARILLSSGTFEDPGDPVQDLHSRLEENPAAKGAAWISDTGALVLLRRESCDWIFPLYERFQSGAYLLELLRVEQEAGYRIVIEERPQLRFQVQENFHSERQAVSALSSGREPRFRREGDKTLAKLDEALSWKPDYAAALAERAEVLLEMGRNSEAIECAKLLYDAAPGWSRAYHLVGLAFSAFGSEDRGGAWLYMAQQLDPRNFLVLKDLGAVSERLHREDFAFAAYLGALVHAPGDQDSLKELVRLLQGANPELRARMLQTLERQPRLGSYPSLQNLQPSGGRS